MAKVLKCNSIFLGCGHVIRAADEDDLMRQAVEHARDVHGVTEIDEQMARLVKASVTDE